MTQSVKKPTEKEMHNSVRKTLHSYHIFDRNEIDRYNKLSRFGFYDPYNTLSVTREYIFITKPDLHIFEPNTQQLNKELSNIPLFVDAYSRYPEVLNQLQMSTRYMTNYSPFCNLLINSVRSSVDLPGISISTLETASNIAGTKMEYMLATTSSSNIHDFTLEFEDTKNLEVYNFFRIFYEYELLKKDGLVTPPYQDYIFKRILHDQFSIYKICVGEDLETIVHFSKLWGVFPTSIPRDTFSDLPDNSQLKLSVSFKCQWVEDNDPLILSDFNSLVADQKNKYNKDLPIYDKSINGVNNEWAHTPYIQSIPRKSGSKPVYKLKWR